MSEKLPPPPLPETGARDVAEVSVAGLLSLVPGAGGWLSAGFQKVFAQQEQQRLNAYLGEVAEVINRLTETVDGLTPEQLASTPEFYDAAVMAARIATATASQNKHRALQNALFHLGSGTDSDADLRLTFVRFIDDLTDTHVHVLQDFARFGGQYVQMADLSSMAGGEAETELFAGDLQTRGMIEERPIITRRDGGMTMFQSAAEGEVELRALASSSWSLLPGLSTRALLRSLPLNSQVLAKAWHEQPPSHT